MYGNVDPALLQVAFVDLSARLVHYLFLGVLPPGGTAVPPHESDAPSSANLSKIIQDFDSTPSEQTAPLGPRLTLGPIKFYLDPMSRLGMSEVYFSVVPS